MKTFSPLLLALLLTACATRPSFLEQEIAQRKAEREFNTADHLIEVQTMPPGAIIDFNNDVVGTSPCTILTPQAYKAQWPANGYTIQTINARWIDGSRANQTFYTGTPMPKHVAFLHPIPNKILPQPPTLSQR